MVLPLERNFSRQLEILKKGKYLDWLYLWKCWILSHLDDYSTFTHEKKVGLIGFGTNQ